MRVTLIPRSQGAWVILVLAVVWFALFFELGRLPLIQPDEGRNAEVAREMNESGAWISPSYDGMVYLDKPAFYFKAVAVALAAFGNNETAARLPSALFALGILASVFAFCRRAYGTNCAVMAVIVIATMPLFVVNARTVIFDIALAFFESAAIFAGFLAEECEGKSRRNWYLLSALSAGLATLVKGPVGFLIPGLVLFVFNRVEGRHGVWKRFFAPLNLLVFFSVTLPWFIGLSLQHPDFPYYGLVEESFHRFTTTSFHRAQPFYFYALIVAGLFLPWSLILPEAAVAAWKNKKAMSSADRLCLTWAIVVVVFFSLSKSKLPGYILTATVACGILTARFFERAMENPGNKAARIIFRAAAMLSALSFLAAIVVMVTSPLMSLLAGPFGISVADAAALGHHFTASIILLIVLAALGLLSRYRRDAGLCFLFFAICPLLVFTMNLGTAEVIFNAKSGRELSKTIPALPPGTRLVFLECFPSDLPFYLERTVTVITKDGTELKSNYILFCLANSPAWPANLVPQTNFDQYISQRKSPVYVLTSENNRTELEGTGIRPADIHRLNPPYIGALFASP
jgi:4-amino-4-deoxy-L-arabinose transferase-like glycosyltransferase